MSNVPFTREASAAAHASIAHAKSAVFWLDHRPSPRPPVTGSRDVDLLVVGGGFSGLWTAIEARRRNPDRSVLLVEGGRIAHGASGRNGGFLAATLTHGLRNGHDRWPSELPELLRLGQQNLDEIEAFISSEGIDCGFRRAGEQTSALTANQVAEVEGTVELARQYGLAYELLDREQVQAEVHSPMLLAAAWDPRGTALVDPARLAWGLADAAERHGAAIAEGTPVLDLQASGDRVVARLADGHISARQVALGTSAFPPLLRRLRHYVVPVYDYVLVTEPLTPAQWESIGWADRRGLADAGNQFHYYRPTDDGRILWGGYDAVYHFGNAMGPSYERDRAYLPDLAQRFLDTFPQLEGIHFTHAWGGAIDTCSRFTAFWGTAHGGRTAYSVGFTGMGVGSSRFGAQVMLDQLEGRSTERTRLEMVRSKPLPFPPEPIRSAGIAATVAALRSADRSGRRNLWLRTLDRLGMGFDS